MARDKEGKWIGYAEWKRRQIEAGKILPRAPVSAAAARPEAKPPAPTLPPYSPEEEAAYMREWEKRHPTLGRVLRTWKSIAERTVATPWGQKVGEVTGRVLTGVEPTTPSPKVSKLGEVTAEIVGTGLGITGAMTGLGIPGAAAAPTVLRTGAMRVAPTAVVQAEKALERLHPVLRRAGTAALVEAPAWWGYERALYPEEHKPPAEALPQYMWQFGAFAGAMEAAPRLIRYLRRPKAAPRAEVKPPEVKVEEVKPPTAEVKPPEAPAVEVKPPEAPAPKPPEAPPAEELPVKVGERMTARRKRTGKEYTGVVEEVFYGAPTKKGERPLLARIRLDDGTVKTIPASRKHTEWRVPEAEVPKAEVPEVPKVETPTVVARPPATPSPVLPPMVTITREEGGTVAVMFPDWAHVRLFNIWRTPGRELGKAGLETRAELAGELGLPKGVDVDEVAAQYRKAILAAVRGLPADAKYEAPHLAQIWAGATPRIEVAEAPPAPEVKPEVPPAPAKPYEGLRPGTEQWMKVWREHPELQKEMVEYGKRIETLAARPQEVEVAPEIGRPEEKTVLPAPPGLPKGVTPSTPAEARTAVKEIVKTFERLGTPIRVGRYYEKARGIYKVRPEVVRTKLFGDVVAISHEVGHHLDKLWKLSSIARHRGELVALAQEAGVKAKTPATLASEGVAEFVRLAITDPAAAQTRAPGMWQTWRQLLDQHPEVADVLEEVGRRIRGLAAAEPEARLLATMSVGEAPTRRRLFQSWNDFMAKMVDELAALDPFRRAAEAKLGRKLEPLEDPMMLAWRARGWQGRAQAFLRYGVRDAVGNKVAPGFQEALETATAGLRGTERIKRVNDFRAYAYARRLLEIEPRVRVLPGEGTFGRQQVIADAQATFAKFDSPAFRQAFDMLQQYQEQMLRQTLGESGLYTQEMINQIIAANEAYLPLHRVFEAVEAGRVRGAGRGYVDLQEAIRKLKGSGRLVIDPLESVVKNTYLFTSLAERNKVGAAIVNLVERAEGLGLWAERVMPKRYAVTVNLEEVLARADKELRQALEDIAADLGVDLDQAVTLFRPAVVGSPKENIAVVWRNGKAELWQFHPELYEALKWMDRETVGAIGRLFTYPAVILRAGAVWYNPVFWLRNPVRDQWTAFVFSKYGYIPGVDLVRGLLHLLRRDELYQLYHSSGAAQSTLVSFDRNYLQRDLRALLGQGKPSAINFLQDISEAMEIATRLGEFERGLAKLGRTEEGLLRAAIAARDITVDFGRAGTWGKVANRYAAFFNANVQGLDKMVRAFKEDPVGVTARVILGVTLPSVALYLLNRRNPNYWALSDYERDLYWHFPLPDGRFVRIAKPFEVGVLFGSFPERVLSWVDKQDPSAVETLAGEMKPYLENLARGLIPNPIPTAAQPLVSLAWRPVVPAWERELPPEAQYSPFTSGVGRLVGKVLGVSPRWFDWFVRNYTGGAGVFAVDVIDKALEAAGLPVPPARQGIPFLRDWIAKPTASTDPLTSQFYDAVAEIEGKVRAAKEAIKRGERERLTPEEFQMDLLMPYLNKQRELLSTLRRIQRMTMASPNLSDREKQAVWEALDSMMLNYVRSLFGMPMVYNPRAGTEEAQAVTQRAVLDYLRRQQILEEYQRAKRAVTGR